MYSFDYLERIWNLIDHKIYLERLQYIDYCEQIEEYLAEYIDKQNAIIIGDTMGINLLLRKSRSIDDFYYVLYSENALMHANNLTNKLENINLLNKFSHNIFLKTSIPYTKYQIYINTRMFITFIRLPDNTYDLIVPELVKTFNKRHDVLVLSPEVQLVDIYRYLYSPHLSEMWEDILDDENKLFVHLQNRINTNKLGASEIITLEDRKIVENQILQLFVQNNKNIILIGDHAFKIAINIEIKTTVIQVISQNNFDDDFLEVEKIIKNSMKRQIPVTKIIRDLHIMQDFRLYRMTIKIGDTDTGQKEIMYIYNSAQYDLIPFNTIQPDINFIQVGNPFVLLRFLLIDYWIVRWIKLFNGIDESFAQQRLGSILNNLILLRTKIQSNETVSIKRKSININVKYFDSYTDLNSLPFRIFQSLSENYIGVYDDENISQKLMIKDITKKFYDYYPADYLKKNNKYREIDNYKK